MLHCSTERISWNCWSICRGEQIYYLLIVNFDEWSSYYRFWNRFAQFYLLKHLFDNTRNDPQFLLVLYGGGSSTHGVGFAATGLTICKYCCIVALKASEHKILHTLLIYVLLSNSFPKHVIEGKTFVFSNNYAWWCRILNAGALIESGLPVNHRPHSDSNTNSTFWLLLVGLLLVHLISY